MDIPNTNVVYAYDDELMSTDKMDEKTDDDNEEILKEIISKSKKQNINKGWNDKTENIIISIGENAISYKYMHERSARLCNRIHNTIKVILITFSTLLSVITTFPDFYYTTILKYILTYIVTLLSVLMHFLQHANKAIHHKKAAAEFSKLYHDIQQQMCLYRRDRIIAFKFLSKIFKTYDSLNVTSPEIHSLVLNNFKKKFINSQINIENVINKMQKIDIIDEENDVDNNQFKISSRDVNIDLKIDGDITDIELNKCNPQNIKDLRTRFFKENATYEYMRFLNNEIDD
jgi:hypothetical protein